MGDNNGWAIALCVILGLIIVALVMINMGSKECISSRDCSDGSYCGSDNRCHEHPGKIVVQKESRNLIFPAAILGLSLIISAYIFRRK